MSSLALRTEGRRWVGLVEGATAVMATAGGIGLALNGLGMPDADAPAWLGGDWRLPGLALALVIGGGQGVAAVAELRDSRRSGALTLAAGAAMVAFEVAELRMIPFSWMTPAFLGVGLVEMASSATRSQPAASTTGTAAGPS